MVGSLAGVARMDVQASVALRKLDRMLWLEGGTFTMGSEHYYREESPPHRVTVSGFWIDSAPVTNRQFAQFLEATNYVTIAERPTNAANHPGTKMDQLAPSSVVFVRPQRHVDIRNPPNWWRHVRGADWRHPLGPNSSIEGLENHPVVHIAYEDAEAYCQWSSKELPTEAEWEFAARGGLEGSDYAWGDELEPDGEIMANTWQGEFPVQNLAADGFEWTSPVGSFPANGYGLYDMIGNVWEWTSDWYQEHSEILQPGCGIVNPKGGKREKSYDLRLRGVRTPRKVIKGGSYLCSPNYCQRYRPAARMAQAIDTATCHLGFRCVRRAAGPRK
jgi:formylglycine-generating enzyme